MGEIRTMEGIKRHHHTGMPVVSESATANFLSLSGTRDEEIRREREGGKDRALRLNGQLKLVPTFTIYNFYII